MIVYAALIQRIHLLGHIKRGLISQAIYNSCKDARWFSAGHDCLTDVIMASESELLDLCHEEGL